jgi:hypothetical protein
LSTIAAPTAVSRHTFIASASGFAIRRPAPTGS